MEEREKITEAGRKELEERYRHLIDVEKPAVQESLKAAREQGDLSENADYDAALSKLQDIENKINSIKYTLEHAEVVANIGGKNVSVVTLGGAPVTFVNLKNGQTITFSIVGPAEADLSKGKVSNLAPIAQALLGKHLDDVCTVHVANPYDVRIIKIGK